MLDHTFDIDGRTLGGNEKPYFIAEAGSNFNQDMDTAKRLIDVAAKAGADAVKFQLFQADVLQSPGTKLHDIFKSIQLNPDWVPQLATHAKSMEITFLASPFDEDMVDVLIEAGAPALKVASSETTKMGLLTYMASKKIPLLLSTGMCDYVDVFEAVQACKRAGNSQVALMQCVSVYPLPPEQANLRVMDAFRRDFGGVIGYSDHALGLTSCIAAAARGAQVIEKHITLDRSSDGPDHFYAIEPDELTELIKQVNIAHDMLGERDKFMLPDEIKYGRRVGLIAKVDILPGDVISHNILDTTTPAHGIRERYRPNVIGYKAVKAIPAGEPLQWDDIEP